MTPHEINHMKFELSKMGALSLRLINETQSRFGKNEIWDTAVEINKMTHDLHNYVIKLPSATRSRGPAPLRPPAKDLDRGLRQRSFDPPSES